jgi:hypothetical protein
MMRKTLLFGIALIAVLALPDEARASATYPAALAAAANMPCVPPCTICHANNSGGIGTAIKPFATSMKGAGLMPKDDSLIPPALDNLKSQKIDSDGDGVIDVEELAAGDDPNTKGAGNICGGPTYGCGARIEPRGELDGGAAVLALATAAALLALGRRRRVTSRKAAKSATDGSR